MVTLVTSRDREDSTNVNDTGNLAGNLSKHPLVDMGGSIVCNEPYNILYLPC